MVYRVPPDIKQDPLARWNLPERVFFACGACHILAYAFLEKFPELCFSPVWIRPKNNFSGNHVFVTDGIEAFDWHGYSNRIRFINHYFKRHRQKFKGWNADLVPLSVNLTSSKECHAVGMYTRGADQFLHNPIPRARKYLERFRREHQARSNQAATFRSSVLKAGVSESRI